MTIPDSTLNTETVKGTPLPTGVQFHVHINDHEKLWLTPADLANRIETVRKILEDTVQALNKWVFSPEFNLTRVENITIQFRNPDRVTRPARRDGAKAYIYCSDQYVRFLNKQDQEHITRLIFRHVMSFFGGHFDNNSYPDNFILGILNYVRLKAGSFPPNDDIAISNQKNERIWYGDNTMPYFLDFLDNSFNSKCTDGTVRRILAKLGPSYDKKVFQEVTDVPITTLWKMYRASVGIKKNPGEEWISDLDELWPIPKIAFCAEADPENEGLRVFSETIEKPIEALAKAVVAIFKHLYGTPKTTATNVRKFCLVLRPGTRMSDKVDNCVQGTTNYIISLDCINDSKPTAVVFMYTFIRAFLQLDSRTDPYSRSNWNFTGMAKKQTKSESTHRFKNWSWGKIIATFILVKEGLEHAPSIVSWDECFVKFLLSMESDTVYKFYKNLRPNHEYDDSWQVDPNGKTLNELWNEFTASLPRRLRDRLNFKQMKQTVDRKYSTCLSKFRMTTGKQ